MVLWLQWSGTRHHAVGAQGQLQTVGNLCFNNEAVADAWFGLDEFGRVG